MMDFNGAVAVITGSGRGLGRDHALMLASRNCRVVVNDLGVRSTGSASDADPAAEVVEEIARHGGEAVADRHDIVTDAEAVIGTALARFGRLDIVINNAGTLDGGLFAETPADVWQRVFDVHLLGTVAMCRAAWPHLARSPSGRIVNTSSSAMFGGPQLTNYGSAKAAIFGLTKSLALEGAADGIGVNAIMPSAWTRMTARIEDAEILRVLQEHFQSARVSPFVAWLAHPDTKVSGEMFRISGGRAARVVAAADQSIAAADDSPEAWAAQADLLSAKGNLVELESTMACFASELVEADPNLDLSATVARGGVIHDEHEPSH